MSKPLLVLAALSTLSLLGVATGCSASHEEVGTDTANVVTEMVVYQHDAPAGVDTVGGREGDRLLLKVFENGGYLKSLEECDAGLPEARIAPSVAAKMEGSFTGSNRTEVLYVVNVFACDSSHADNYGTTRYVVTEPFATTTGEPKILANAEIQGAIASVNRGLDVDGDGQHEIVITEGYSGMGWVSETPSVVRFAGNNLVHDEAFEAFRAKAQEDDLFGFSENGCATGEEGSATVKSANVFTSKVNGVVSYRAQLINRDCTTSELAEK